MPTEMTSSPVSNFGATRNKLLAFGAVVLLLSGAFAPEAEAAIFTVTSQGNNGPGSLRQAITDANATPGADTIQFNIPGAGVKTITLASTLPTITEQVRIDGYTQPGSSANSLLVGNNAVLHLELNGNNSTVNGLTIAANNCTILGMVINQFTYAGIKIDDSDDHIVQGNWIGLNSAGTAASANGGNGIRVENSNGNLIGGTAPAARNVISGNGRQGILFVDVSNSTIAGNYIGTNANGAGAIPNADAGIRLSGSSANNTVGGTSGSAANLLSGNDGFGIHITDTGSSNNVVAGNLIGLNASGTAALGNSKNGVRLDEETWGNMIGGATVAARNVISGNSDYGINIRHISTSGNTVRNNYIGTNASGTAALSNGGFGVVVLNGADNTQILDNLISGNTLAGSPGGGAGTSRGGIYLSDVGQTTIQRNVIGLDASGDPLGNGGGTESGGIHVAAGTLSPIMIGGGSMEGNSIASNIGTGITIQSVEQVTLLGNTIHDNSGLGIDLGDDGVTVNDLGDIDSGPNALQNFPVLATATTVGGNTTIVGTLNSTASGDFRIEFFSSPAADPSGYGEGANYLGSFGTNTDAAGDASFTAVLTGVSLTDGHVVTATATNIATNNTSEFSAALAKNQPPVAVCQPATVYLDALGNATITTALVDNGSFDPDGTITSSVSPSSVDCSDIGTVTVTLTVTDNGGLTNDCTATVTVLDDLTPVISGCPSNISLSADASCDAVATWTAPTVSDNCSGASISGDHNSGDAFPIGTTTVTYTATDAAGNTSICSFTVTVADDTDPVISGCPSNISLSAGASCDAVATWTAPTVSDNCSGASISGDHNSGDTFPLGTTTVTYTATDAAGNTSICSFTVTVTDDTDPVISGCPGNISLSAGAACTAVATWTAPTVSDNCSGASISGDQNSGDAFPLGTTTVTYTASDAAGNSSTCSFTVTVADNTDPVISGCPGNISLSAGAGCDAVATWTAPTVSDNCSGATISGDHNSGDTFPLGTTTVTYTATDAAGNTSICSFTVTVTDNTPPNAVCQSLTVYLDAAGQATISPADLDGGSSDNCSIAGMSISQSTFDCTDLGMNTVALTVTDPSGNSATCTSTVTVADTLSPTITCPTNLIVNNDPGLCSATVNYPMPVVSDNCSSNLVMTAGLPSGSIFPTGTTTVSYRVTDPSGLSDSCSFTVTVIDAEAPVISCQNVSVIMDASGQASITAAMINGGSTDNCGIASITASPTTFTAAGNFPVTLTVTDINGNTSTCASTVTVIDNTPPVILCQPTTIYIDNNGTAILNATDIDAGSSDNSGTLSLFTLPSTFNCGQLGSNSTYLLGTDASGNMAFCATTVTVLDTLDPVAVCQDITVNLGAGGTVTITPAMVGANSTDNCGGSLNFALSQTTFNATGTYTVVLTVTDASGNTSTCSSTVTVIDNEPPVAICQDATIYLDQNGNAALYPGMINAGSYDLQGPVTLSTSQSSFGCNQLGANNVTLIVTDNSGGQSFCLAQVTVLDTIAPVAACQDITVSLGPDGTATITGAMIGANSTDNCGSALNYTISQSTFTGTGTYSVVFTVTDASGNSSSCTSTVTVTDDTPPIAICQDDTIYLDNSGAATITPEMIDAGSYDIGGTITLSASQLNFNCNNLGANNVTLIITDNTGNQTFCLSTVTVLDTIAPAAACQDITVGLDPDGTATITGAMVGGNSTDNCGNALTYSLSQYTFSSTGAYTVVLTVTDASGNSSTCTSTVTVNDDAAPVAVCQDTTIYLDPDGHAGITPEMIDGGSYDVGGTISLGASQTDFGCNNLGANNVTLIVTDNTGNQAFCLSTVTVLDTIAPVAVCQDISVVLDNQGQVSITGATIGANSTDNCPGGLSYSLSQSNFNATGTYTVVLTVTDASGNSSTCSSTVTVIDNTPPVAQCQNTTIYLDGNGNASITPQQIDGGSFDNAGITAMTASQTVFGCVDLGTNPVTLTVFDNMGNTATCEALVTVLDTLAPTAICQDITAYLDPSGQVTISAADIGGSSTDNCGSGPLTLQLDTLHFAGEGQFQVVLTVTDASGNTSTCTALVNTVKPQPPLVIPAGFSPNDDGIADNWVIQGLEYYPANDVVIFNRWGSLLYKAAPYLNDWHGQVTSGGAMPGELPAGTYFYQLSLGNGDVRTGYLQLNR